MCSSGVLVRVLVGVLARGRRGGVRSRRHRSAPRRCRDMWVTVVGVGSGIGARAAVVVP
ncbi:MAG: hypothetical protein R2713_00410 [Ilumatobacteraceae bacterium]